MQTLTTMKHFMLTFIFSSVFVYAQSQSPETRIKNYYIAFETKDWNMLAEQLAEGFTFTSPAGDDHITLSVFKERCWPTSKYFKTISFPKIMVEGNTAFAIYDIATTDNKIVHNVEYYTFSNGKIKSVECFFGTGIGYPGNSSKAK